MAFSLTGPCNHFFWVRLFGPGLAAFADGLAAGRPAPRNAAAGAGTAMTWASGWRGRRVGSPVRTRRGRERHPAVR